MFSEVGLRWFNESRKVVVLVLLFLVVYIGCASPLYLYTYQNSQVEAAVGCASTGFLDISLNSTAFIGMPIYVGSL